MARDENMELVAEVIMIQQRINHARDHLSVAETSLQEAFVGDHPVDALQNLILHLQVARDDISSALVTAES